ncbi:hypothetical protein DSO57_1036857 [Entomophthora muscae]|uniref:Uncharacterized protein n=1 Tax=Entomophthora muscae TaxID=34485 RepID=A0ACC2UJK2_9FUNG|nr:hypothetical protein DSO57_1036857 [Entomophthora muscae]
MKRLWGLPEPNKESGSNLCYAKEPFYNLDDEGTSNCTLCIITIREIPSPQLVFITHIPDQIFYHHHQLDIPPQGFFQSLSDNRPPLNLKDTSEAYPFPTATLIQDHNKIGLEAGFEPRPWIPTGCWAYGLLDHPPVYFLGIKPLKAEAPVNSQSQNTDISPTIVAPKEEPIKLPNEGRDGAYVRFMSLKSSQATNQEPTQERGTGLQPGPMTTTLKQDNQVAKLRILANERTPGPGAILLLSDPSTQFPRPSFPQCPDEPMENVNSRSPSPPAPLPAVFCPPGAPFGPVHFTDYPLKPEYKDYTPEKIIKLDPLARIQSAVRYNCQGLWIFSTPKLFRGKFNYLPAYNVYMEPPVTPKLMPASSSNLPTDHTSKLFGIVYITLTGVVDTVVPAAGPWSWLGKSASYLLKLAPLLWWALPAKNPAQVTSEPGRTAA